MTEEKKPEHVTLVVQSSVIGHRAPEIGKKDEKDKEKKDG
jgi:hypothetical protein